MWHELLTKILSISVLFVPIAAGVGMGIASRGKFGRATEKRMAKICEDAALKFFLPFFVIESISKSSPSYDLALEFVVGFALPLITLVGMWVYKQSLSHKSFFTPHYDDLRFLASTFGGGNRGTALFVLLFANSNHFNDYLKWFILIDLGNFACLLLFISGLLVRQYGQPLNDNRHFLSKLFDNYAIITIFVTFFYFVLWHYWPDIETMLSETVHMRKFIFGFLVFLAITLRFEHGVLKNFFVDLLGFLFARIFAAVCLIALLIPLLPELHPIYFGVIVLLMMPPSSLFPSMIGQSNAPKETLSYVNGFTGAANVLYLFLIVIGIVVAVSQALQ